MASANPVIEQLGALAVFAFLVGAALVAIARRSLTAGVLSAVAVAFAVRLVVMIVSHSASLELGEGGIMFLDDETYVLEGQKIADGWSSGLFVYPAAYNYAGTYEFGYQTLVGTVFLVAGPSVFAAKLLNVVLGTATVLMVALLAQRTLGEEAKRRAAWLVALAPGVVWWSAPMMKEAFSTFLVVTALFWATRLSRGLSGPIVFSFLLGVLFVTRSAAALTVLVAVAVAYLIAARQSPERKDRRNALIALGTLVGAGLAFLVLVSSGQPGAIIDQYSTTVGAMIDRYQGSNAALVPFDMMKTLVTPLPWAFDIATRHWDRGLYPGMWLLYGLYPLALLGAWRLRHRPEGALLVLAVVLVLALTAYTSGFAFRQRSNIEPLIVLLAVAGMTSWRQAAQWAAAALVAVAAVAAVHTGSPAVGAAIAAAGLALALGARFMPAHRFSTDLPPSPIASSLAGLRDMSFLDPLRSIARRTLRLGRLAPTPTAPEGQIGAVGEAGAYLAGLRSVAPHPTPLDALRSPHLARWTRALRALRRAAPVPEVHDEELVLRRMESGAEISRRLASRTQTGLGAARRAAPKPKPVESRGLNRTQARLGAARRAAPKPRPAGNRRLNQAHWTFLRGRQAAPKLGRAAPHASRSPDREVEVRKPEASQEKGIQTAFERLSSPIVALRRIAPPPQRAPKRRIRGRRKPRGRADARRERMPRLRGVSARAASRGIRVWRRLLTWLSWGKKGPGADD